MTTIDIANKKENFFNTLNGIWFVALFALAAMYLAQFSLFKNLEISPLIIAIVLGMIYSNLVKQQFPAAWTTGVTFSAKK